MHMEQQPMRFLAPFAPQGRGTVVTGRVEQGIVKSGDSVEIVGIRPSTTTTVTGACRGPGRNPLVRAVVEGFQ